MSLDRRTFLKYTAAAAGAGILGRSRSADAADDIVYVSVQAFSGNFAANGKFSEAGVKLALKRLEPKLGRRVTYVPIDTEGNPAKAVRKVQDVIDQRGAKFFGSAALSSEALAVMKEVHKAGGVYITYVGADEVTGSECNRSTFRWSLPTYGAIQTVVKPLIAANPKWKRWYTITPQYVFGEALLRNAKVLFEQNGIEHIGNSYHSLTEKEFSGYLTNAIASKADVLLVLNFGAQAIDTLRQVASFGMKSKTAIVVPWTSGLDAFRTLGADTIDGMYFGAQYWHTLDTPLNREFVAAHRAEYKSVPPFYTAADYAIVTLMLNGMMRAGKPDPAAVIKALEGYKYDGLTGPEEVRAFDHQVDKSYLLMRGKPKAKLADADDFVDIVNVGRALVPLSQSACKMA